MKKILATLLLILSIPIYSFSQTLSPEREAEKLAQQQLGMALQGLVVGNLESTSKGNNNRTKNLTFGLASESSTNKNWTLDLGVRPFRTWKGDIYYQEQTGLITLITYDRETDSGLRFIIDPDTQEILDKVEFEADIKDLNSIGAISPDGRYLVQDRIYSKKVIAFDLSTGAEVAEAKKDQGPRYTGAAFNGVAFINNTDYLVVEGKASKVTTLSKLKAEYEIVHRRLPDNNEIERWTIPQSHIEKWKIQGMNQYLSGIKRIAYNPVSPWGVPVLAVQNLKNILIYDFQTKTLKQTIRTDIRLGLTQSLNFSMKDYLIFGGDVYKLSTGELFASLNGDRDPFGGSNGVLAESNLSECKSTLIGEPRKPKTWTLGIKGFTLPRAITEEIAYKNWLKRCAAKKDSLAILANSINPLFSMNSPENDWIYIGTEGVNGQADGIGSAIRKDGMRFIIDGLFIEGEFVAGKMENVYEVSMEGEFMDMKLNGFGRHITENKAILEGNFVDGKLDGKGETIDPSGMQYVGDFKNGAFEGKGKITRRNGEMYDGEFLAGKPHGSGIYKDGSTIERCEYYEGQRIDQAYLIRKENERAERQRQLEQLQAQQRQEYLAQQQKKKSSNGLFGALLMGTGFGIAGASVGMDAMQAVEFGGAMFQDVQSGGTSNLNNFQSNMMADFQAKRAQYENYTSDYADKFYSPVKSTDAAGTAASSQSNQVANTQAWQERQQRIEEMKIRAAQKKEEQRRQQIENCRLKDPECKSCHCAALLDCNRGSNCQPD
jgi:hypothetical protein